MTEGGERLRLELIQLPVQDRAELAHFLIQSLDEEAELDWESAWEVELMRRAQKIERGLPLGEPADKVLAELREKYA